MIHGAETLSKPHRTCVIWNYLSRWLQWRHNDTGIGEVWRTPVKEPIDGWSQLNLGISLQSCVSESSDTYWCDRKRVDSLSILQYKFHQLLFARRARDGAINNVTQKWPSSCQETRRSYNLTVTSLLIGSFEDFPTTYLVHIYLV